MEHLARRQMLQLFFAAGLAAAAGVSATAAAETAPADVSGLAGESLAGAADGVAFSEPGLASELQPDQAVVVRRGRRYGRGRPRIIIRPGRPWRRRRRRLVCVRRRGGRLVCRPRWY